MRRNTSTPARPRGSLAGSREHLGRRARTPRAGSLAPSPETREAHTRAGAGAAAAVRRSAGRAPRRVETPLEETCSQAGPGSAICVQSLDDSLNSAIRTTYRISLRSSSLREPRYPSAGVVCGCFCSNRFARGRTRRARRSDERGGARAAAAARAHCARSRADRAPRATGRGAPARRARGGRGGREAGKRDGPSPP